jgi:hypothetical protein
MREDNILLPLETGLSRSSGALISSSQPRLDEKKISEVLTRNRTEAPLAAMLVTFLGTYPSLIWLI